MKIYKLSFRNLMDNAANKLSNKILNFIIKKNELNSLAGEHTITIKYEGFPSSLDVKLDIAVNPNQIDNFILDGLYEALQHRWNPNIKSINRKLTVYMSFNDKFSKKDYNKLYFKLVETLRHELQHFVDDENTALHNKINTGYDIQKLKNPMNQNPIAQIDERTKYILSVVEQEPFIRGLMLVAKKQQAPLELMIKELIWENLFGGIKEIKDYYMRTIGELEVEHREKIIFDALMNKAKKIFPNLAKEEKNVTEINI